MLSNLDCIIFPDRCEVIEIVPSQRYVYPIFKNGSSSLFMAAKQHSWSIRLNQQIKKIAEIQVVLRDPQSRLVSGINTFIQQTMRDHPSLDRKTVIWFAKNYLYLNRHYAPQFSWLVNLARYMNSDTTIKFITMQDLDSITELHKKPSGVEEVNPEILQEIGNIENLEMYQRLDQVLVDYCIGQVMTFEHILRLLNTQDSAAYDWVIGRSQRILSPTHALSAT